MSQRVWCSRRLRTPTSTPTSTTSCTLYGIYAGKDYNAWIAKIACKRLRNGLDTDATKAAQFVHINLAKDSTTEQAYQFLGAALRMYCPDQMPVLQQVAQ